MKKGIIFYECTQCRKAFPDANMNDVEIKVMKQSLEETTREFWCDMCVLDTNKGIAVMKAMKMVGENKTEADPETEEIKNKKGKK